MPWVQGDSYAKQTNAELRNLLRKRHLLLKGQSSRDGFAFTREYEPQSFLGGLRLIIANDLQPEMELSPEDFDLQRTSQWNEWSTSKTMAI